MSDIKVERLKNIKDLEMIAQEYAQYYTNSILQEKRDILIRDLSILGFPTFSIAIPGMSEIGFDPNCTYLKLMDNMENLLKDFRNINLDNIFTRSL